MEKHIRYYLENLVDNKSPLSVMELAKPLKRYFSQSRTRRSRGSFLEIPSAKVDDLTKLLLLDNTNKAPVAEKKSYLQVLAEIGSHHVVTYCTTTFQTQPKELQQDLLDTLLIIGGPSAFAALREIAKTGDEDAAQPALEHMFYLLTGTDMDLATPLYVPLLPRGLAEDIRGIADTAVSPYVSATAADFLHYIQATVTL